MKNSTYLKLTLSIGLGLLILFAGINIYVDPLFHFHAPTKGIEYPLYDERYMDDGILRNFDYDAVITGTSMTQNFKTSQFDQFFGTNSVKVPSSGGTYKEIGDLLRRAFEYNPNIRYVMRSLDTTVLVADKDALDYEEYPDYLYDRNPFNDVNYVLNKDLYNKYTEYVFTYNRLGGNTTPFDVYKNWSGVYEVNGAKLLAEHVRREKTDEKKIFTEEDAKMLSENLEQNVLSLVREHPETEFYFFDPPYSLLFFDDLYCDGKIDYYVDAWTTEAQMLLQYDNIHFFSFWMDVTVMLDFEHYKDSLHYEQKISDYIIDCMGYDLNELSLDNYQQYFDQVRAFYNAVDYDAFFNK